MEDLMCALRRLSMSTATWSRDSHELFDYESKDVWKQTMIVPSECYLIRIGNEVQAVRDRANIPHDQATQLLARVLRVDNGFALLSCEDEGGEPLWLVVKELEQGSLGVPLTNASVLKLGRVKFAVRQLEHTEAGVSTDNSSDEEDLEQRACKICFGGDEPDNPLLSPCLCAGSMRYIHLSCLQRWLDSKRNVAHSELSTAYYWENFLCEICKHSYPLTLAFKGRKYDLFKLDNPGQTTMVLEMLKKDRQSRGVHLISMKPQSTVKLGRGHESDCRISDISVSRLHANLNYDGTNFYLKDNGSKFGSLMQLTTPLHVTLGQRYVLQMGRTVISFGATNEPLATALRHLHQA